MSTELDDDHFEVRDEDKTRQIQLSAITRPVIDDLGKGADTLGSALPAPEVSPFEPQLAPPSAPKAPPPAVRPSAPNALPPPPVPGGGKPPPPPVPGAAKPPVEDDPNAPPTIIVKAITHEPTRRLQREATVVVKRMVGPTVRRTKKSPVVAAVIIALALVGGAIAFTAIRRWNENRQRERSIEQRIQELRREHTPP